MFLYTSLLPCYMDRYHQTPAVAIDVVALSPDRRQVILIQRKYAPWKGMWALPGGFVEYGETLETAARRELQEECGVTTEAPFHQVKAFDAPDRDPRQHLITIAHCVVLHTNQELVAGDDAQNARWFPVDRLPDLASDHGEMVPAALRLLQK